MRLLVLRVSLLRAFLFLGAVQGLKYLLLCQYSPLALSRIFLVVKYLWVDKMEKGGEELKEEKGTQKGGLCVST